MPDPSHIKSAKKLIRDLQKKVYFPYAIPAYDQKIDALRSLLIANGNDIEYANKQAERQVLSYLHDVMRDAEPFVDAHIASRIDSGAITDPNQARKAAAGNLFQQFLAYALAKNIIIGNITSHVSITMSPKTLVDKFAAINVGDDVLKPDADVLVYCDDNDFSPIMVFSCKTSLRERAGQTYKWKLLCDLATCKCDHITNNNDCPVTRYHLNYAPERKIETCFATADFYNELNNPQIVAMLSFFDHSYIAKPVARNEKIRPLESVIDDINTI